MAVNVVIRPTGTAFIAATLLSALPLTLAAQGCEPIRFTSPVNLGGGGQAYQPAQEWQLTLAYRRLVSKEWFVGTDEASELAPGGKSPILRIHTVVADVAYAINDRYRVSLSVPFQSGSLSRIWPDKAHHQQTATGLGDLTLSGEAWAMTPRTHERGNVAVKVGVKIPTGSHTLASNFFTAAGAVKFPADQTIQPGDGGWGLVLETRGFRKFTERLNGYGFASYMISPKEQSEVQWIPESGRYWAVPDVYSARTGIAFAALPDRGLTLSLGGRIDGIPIHDLIGGGDDETIKRTGYVIFVEPGLSYLRGSGILSLNVPYRLAVNRQKSVFEKRTGALNAGGFAKALVFASYTHRF